MCESSICSPDLNIITKYPSQLEVGKEMVGGDPLKTERSPATLCEGVVPKVPGNPKRGPFQSRSCLPEARPEEHVPAHVPEACWAAEDHPCLGGSTCHQSRQEHTSTFLPCDSEFSLASADVHESQCSQSELDSRNRGPSRAWGPEPCRGLFPNRAELGREQCLFLCSSFLCIPP